jgi:hypothetical protein
MVRGAGLGAIFVPAMAASYYGLRIDEYPRATSAVRSFQQVGASFGTAVLAVILQHQSRGAADAAGLADAFGHTFWWAVGFTALAFVPALFFPAGGRHRRRRPPPHRRRVRRARRRRAEPSRA